MIVVNYEDLCPDCYGPYTNKESKWCKECNAKQFQQDFWTSGNEFIDGFIRETQLNATSPHEFLEWIPYNKFKDIEFLDKGGFSTVYKATWLDGPIEQWPYDERKWIRKKRIVALKSLNDSSNLSEEFLNEV